MSIFDSIRNIFRKKSEVLTTETPKEIRVNPLAEPSSNVITLSPDMSTLYLIDNNRVISFNINTKFGIDIGTLNGQLTAATALPVIIRPDDEEDTEDPEAPDSDDSESPGPGVEDSPIRRLAERPRHFKISTIRKQFTLMFVKDKGVLSIIGASDIDTSIIGASDIDTSIIGASDIDTSLTRSIDPGIIGASDIDTSLTRGIEPEPAENADLPEEFDTQTSKNQCFIYSFRINNSSINIRKVGTLLIIKY